MNEENLDFCPNCGKILVIKNNKAYCSKCNIKIKINTTNSENIEIEQDNFNNYQKRREQKKKNRELNNIKENQTTGQSLQEWERFFPYKTIRAQQETIISTILNTINEKKHILIQAVNGVGKTISLLTGVLPTAKKEKKVVVYTCRTHEQMDRVAEELKNIRLFQKISAITLRGRKELCPNKLIQKFAVDAKNTAEICAQLKKEGKCKFFNNLSNSALISKLIKDLEVSVLDSTDLWEIGETFEICPYEISKKLLLKADVVATSYQYIFNPFIFNTFLSHLEKSFDEIILIIDEAHNLPSTAIEISSESLSSIAIENAMSEAAKAREGFLYDFLEALNFELERRSKELRTEVDLPYNPINLLEKVRERSRIRCDETVIESLELLADKIKEEKMKKNKAPLSSASSVARFLGHLLDSIDKEEYAQFISVIEGRRRNRISTFTTLALDPRVITKRILQNVFFAISASGTLEPIESYQSLIGVDKKDSEVLILDSPYTTENIQSLVINGVSTKLSFRTPDNFKKMNELIEAVVNATPKNIGIFCASYKILESLLENGLEERISKPMFITYQGMSSRDSFRVINSFKDEGKFEGGVLLSVLGGRSSEGSDYPAEMMQSVIIVGIPFAKPNAKIEASIQYLEKQFPGKGREYGYTIPAMTRAAQAAGRPIRSLQDIASIILMDYRFGIEYYRKHLPSWITGNIRIMPADKKILEERIREFFNSHFK